MKQTFKEIKPQLTPDKRTVDNLLSRIHGNEGTTVKTGGIRWAALVPLTAVMGLVLLGGMLVLSGGDEKIEKDIQDSTEQVQKIDLEPEKEYGYPAASTMTAITEQDGKFDLMNGGYYSHEKHSPKDPPPEDVKRRLLENNLEIYIDNGWEDDGRVLIGSGDKLYMPKREIYTYKAVEETFDNPKHVSYITNYYCMGKVKDGDRVYELLVGYTALPDKMAISFGDGKYYLYEVQNWEPHYDNVDISFVDSGDGWEYAKNYYDVDNYGESFTGEKEDLIIKAFEDGKYTAYRNKENRIDKNGVSLQTLYSTREYEFDSVCDVSEFDVNDIYGVSFIDCRWFCGRDAVSDAIVFNTPSEDGTIIALLNKDTALKFVPCGEEVFYDDQ